ncbi:MAG: tetratricopeptide repeat protein [Candidatus Cloacimonetes bacterium]|nr:tetratricopeptide repeat protein [Candidatus Cloacimonadota bacterium]
MAIYYKLWSKNMHRNFLSNKNNKDLKNELEKLSEPENIEALKARADAGDPEASYVLATHYLVHEPEEALRLLNFAAENEYAAAELLLGILYTFGIHVEPDEDKALELLQKSARRGDASAQKVLGELYLNISEASKESERNAFFWMKKAADQGNTEAEFYLGFLYSGGIGVKKDPAEAFQWYKKAADKGDPDAQLELAFCYDKGKVVKKDPKEAMLLLQLAAEQGNEYAMFHLGAKYILGNDMEQDLNEAFFWMLLSALYGNDAAHNAIKDGLAGISSLNLIKIKSRVLRWLDENNPELRETFIKDYNYLFD